MRGLEQFKNEAIEQDIVASPAIKRENKPKKKSGFLTPFEKVLILFMFIIVAFVATSVITTTGEMIRINNDNIELQKQIDLKSKLIIDLDNEVSSLSTPESIIEKANKLGLILSGDNVKVVE